MAATRVLVQQQWSSAELREPSCKNSDDEEYRYETKLPEKVLVVAKKELREEPSAREQALVQFRDWIRKNQDLANVRTDNNFLLRFLRAKKFSVPMAQMTLLKYLNLRQTFPHFCFKIDCLDPKVEQLVDNGYLFASPIRDKHGRRVIIGIAANFDPYKYNCRDMGKVHCMTYETLLDDEENQVLGFTHIGDFKAVSTAYITLWSPTEFATVLKWGEQSVPMRHKEVHCLNIPTPLKYVYDFARGRFSQKMKDRFNVHSSLDELYKKVDPKCLPKEYGGVIPMREMIESWKKEILEKREKLVALDKMELLDNSCVLKKNDRNNNKRNNYEIYSIAGSFRKLEVD